MAINIYKKETAKSIAYLCQNTWDLPSQISELEKWLKKNVSSLNKGKYVIDIGFSGRRDPGGGGSTISSSTIKILANYDIDLFLSEYPVDQ